MATVGCIHLPSFPLQAHALRDPHLVGTACAVIGGAPPRVVACSQAARAAGVRPSMTAAHARAIVPSILLVDEDPAVCAGAMELLGAEVTRSLSTPVDVRELGSLYVAVDGRAAPFAMRLYAIAEKLGLRARVGVASNRFVSWAATQARPLTPIRLVPRGDEAGFLAPLPLGLLPLEESTLETLALLGVRTVGDFAALPPPSVARPWARTYTRWQALARGVDESPLIPFLPEPESRRAVR